MTEEFDKILTPVDSKSALDKLIEQTQEIYNAMIENSQNSLDNPDFVNAIENVNIKLRNLRKEKTECETIFMSGAETDLESKYNAELLKMDHVQKLIAEGKTGSEILGALEQISKAL